jgi:hypothetical protein
MQATTSYVVVSNTPGYLPEDDDPFVTDDLDAAKAALRDDVERHLDHLADDPDIGPEGPSVSWSDDETSCYVVRNEHEHDLGRVFEIISHPHDSTCGHCGRTWSSEMTPTPAARCPFEYDHEYDDDAPESRSGSGNLPAVGVLRPQGKETHYATTTEADPFNVEADWKERS